MHTLLTELMLRSVVGLTAPTRDGKRDRPRQRPRRHAPRRDERGDVPGWVMVTVMTIGLAIAIFTFAEEPLKGLLSAAFNRVK